jgi:hypothetical protein
MSSKSAVLAQKYDGAGQRKRKMAQKKAAQAAGPFRRAGLGGAVFPSFRRGLRRGEDVGHF